MNMRGIRIAAGGFVLAVLLVTATAAVASSIRDKTTSLNPTFPAGSVAPEFQVTGPIAANQPVGPARDPQQVPGIAKARGKTGWDTARQSKNDLLGYLRDRRATIQTLRAIAPGTHRPAGITLRKPMAASEAIGLFRKSALDVTYLEWIVPGKSDHGGASPSNWPDVETEYPGAQVVYAIAVGAPPALVGAAGDPAVFLVDIADAGASTPRSLYEAAQQFSVLDQ